MKHQNLFVTIVGLAAWIHSTWSFSVVIGGEVPALAVPTDIPRWLYWVLPGAAAAAAVDVGLISLAAQFRLGRGSRAKLVTFAVLSFISYLGQALFSLSHGGRYIPSSGLSPISVTIASVVWEVLIWALPAALPVTLILWAWSDMKPTERADIERIIEPRQRASMTSYKTLEIDNTPALPKPEDPAAVLTLEYTERCTLCEYTVTKSDPRSARNAVIAHGRIHKSTPVTVHENGRSHEH